METGEHQTASPWTDQIDLWFKSRWRWHGISLKQKWAITGKINGAYDVLPVFLWTCFLTTMQNAAAATLIKPNMSNKAFFDRLNAQIWTGDGNIFYLNCILTCRWLLDFVSKLLTVNATPWRAVTFTHVWRLTAVSIYSCISLPSCRWFASMCVYHMVTQGLIFEVMLLNMQLEQKQMIFVDIFSFTHQWKIRK